MELPQNPPCIIFLCFHREWKPLHKNDLSSNFPLCVLEPVSTLEFKQIYISFSLQALAKAWCKCSSSCNEKNFFD